jgi:integrase
MVDRIPRPKEPFTLPTILSIAEVTRLIDSASNLMHRAILMTLYSTGVRRAELCRLKVSDIDTERMVIHIHVGKGQRDRDVDLSERLLDTLREYWRWMRPKTYLFPGTVNNWRADVPITGKVVWAACHEATVRAGLKKHVYPHLLRQWSDSRAFRAFLRRLFRQDWIVYAKRPFGGPEHVLHYLARYTHRVAISNHRLVSFVDGQVTCLWKDYAHGNKKRKMTLSTDETSCHRAHCHQPSSSVPKRHSIPIVFR